MKLDRSSIGAVAIVWALAIPAAVAAVYFIPTPAAGIALALAALVFAVWQTLFHGVPDRKCHVEPSFVVSAADGKVVGIKRVNEREYLCRECVLVSVYMNFWDVHANFWPVSGEVTYAMYHPGRHFLAFRPKASEENEHNCLCVRTQDGTEIFFKQLAGGFARRVASYASKGQKVKAGEQCGIIKFGSRLDIYLPPDAEILVSQGDVVRACETPLARLKSERNA